MRNFFSSERPFNPSGNLSEQESNELGPRFRELIDKFKRLPDLDKIKLANEMADLRERIEMGGAKAEPRLILQSAEGTLSRLSKERGIAELKRKAEGVRPLSKIDRDSFDRALREFKAIASKYETLEFEQEDQTDQKSVKEKAKQSNTHYDRKSGRRSINNRDKFTPGHESLTDQKLNEDMLNPDAR